MLRLLTQLSFVQADNGPKKSTATEPTTGNEDLPGSNLGTAEQQQHFAAVWAKPTTGNDSAATEHTEELQLTELVHQQAGMSSEIELKIVRSEIIDYTYSWEGNEVSTQKLQVILQSKIPEQYCLGVARLQKKD